MCSVVGSERKIKRVWDASQQAILDRTLQRRRKLRPDKEWDAAARIQKACGLKYNPQFMAESKRKVSSMLNEYGEERSIRECIRRAEGAGPMSIHWTQKVERLCRFF